MASLLAKQVLCGDIITIACTQYYSNGSCIIDYTQNLLTPLNSSSGSSTENVCGDSIDNCMSYNIDGAGSCTSCSNNPIIVKTTYDTNSINEVSYYIYSVNYDYTNKNYTLNAVGTPITYGSYLILYTSEIHSYGSNGTYTSAGLYWQTGPAVADGFNDAINLTAQLKSGDSNIGYQLWVMADPDTLNTASTTYLGVYNGNLNYGPTSKPVVYGSTFLLQSVGKKDSNGNYQFMTIRNSGYNCIISTQAEKNGQPATLDYNTIFVVLNANAEITLSDGTSTVPPSGNYYINGSLGQQNNTSNPAANNPIASTLTVLPLTQVEQVQYDNSRSTLDYLSGGLVFYILLIIFLVFLLLVYHIFFYNKSKNTSSNSSKAKKISYGKNGEEIISY
jgi:hypothetical protein